MCAISGLILGPAASRESAESARSAVAAMIQGQSRRGPDGEGTWDDGRAFLGHNRLAIVDLTAAGRQPMESASWVLTYNGEIFNAPELRADLESRGRTFHGHCDTEVLLQAIEEFGVEGAVTKINGFFAFAAYRKTTGELFLVRDRLGIKPLFYCLEDGAIGFASLPAALARAVKPRWQLDAEAVRRFFLLGAIFGNRTFFSGIQRLEAGTMLRFDPATGDKQTRRYWKPEPRGGSLIGLVDDAVSIRRMGDVPMAVFFSGGVDSTYVASVLREVDAIHLDSPERPFAEEAARRLGLRLTTLKCSDWDQAKIHRDLARHSGEAAMAGPIPYMVASALREKGYKVAFSANGADELFYGYPRTPIPGLPAPTFRFQKHDHPPLRCLRQQVLNIFRHPAHFTVPAAMDRSLTLEELEAELRGTCALEGFPESASYRWLELQTYVLHDLNPTLDFASMAHGLEVRTPFLDYRVVERALSAPPDHLVAPDLGRKAPLKRAIREAGVPDWCIQRPKVGFSLAPETERSLVDAQLQSVEKLRARGLLHVHRSVLADTRSRNSLMASAFAFEAWCEEWIDGGIVSP